MLIRRCRRYGFDTKEDAENDLQRCIANCKNIGLVKKRYYRCDECGDFFKSIDEVIEHKRRCKAFLSKCF